MSFRGLRLVFSSVFALSPAAAGVADQAVPVFQVGPAPYRGATPKAAPQPADLQLSASRLPASARHDLGSLTPEEADKLRAPDTRSGKGARSKRPATKIGITRDLPPGMGFVGLPADIAAGQSRILGGGLLERTSDGTLVWTASFSSTGAEGLRLHLSAARLPPGSRVYVYGGGQIHGPYSFASGTRPEGFWTNTILASTIALEVRVPASAASSELGTAILQVGGVVHLDKAAAVLRPKSDACFIDRSCVTTAEFPNVDDATRAVAQLTFEDSGQFYVCSGGLLNTTDGSSVPYLLTANHCFSTQASATSLEAVWQYRTPTCNGTAPPEDTFPSTLGSTLLATSAVPNSDYTLVQLSESPPDDSVLLGWTTADVSFAAGLSLYRLSYPGGNPMVFTKEQVSLTTLSCSTDDGKPIAQGPFIYEKDIEGGTGEGSSGSPLFLEDLRVVGQLFGACGANPNDDCDSVNNFSIDGAFAATFPSIQHWLAPKSFGSCVPDANSLCLDGARFRVTTYYTKSDGSSGAGNGISLSGDSGYFWFFDAANIELVVKVLTGCPSNGHFWVFAGGLTNVGVTMLVEDTVTGASQTYSNPIGSPYQPLQDTSAFACP